MTREEAREILTHNWTRVDNPNYSESELDEAFFMAIEALKALPSAELPAEAEFADLPDIPRAYYEKVVGNMAHEISMLKEQLESAEAEWTPCSEKLPSEDGCYLVSTTGTNNDIIDIAYYTEEIWHKASRIKAWMPLPKPYREDGE